ncbi:MAG TPA: peptidoglycan bridge formation glycyltransferase FemA/FemB family protein [Thermomicrobiales bacterium]|nr:peptidoglycan bridge formation glycyltransferase FemA/FemB family protein [Thermomicrobiales bacterium]
MRPDTAWNDRLAALDGHHLQSWEWGDFKRSHGWTPERILVEAPAGAAMAQVLYRHQAGLSLGYVPRGPVFEGDPNALWPMLRSEIDRSARAHRAILTLLEPNAPVGLAGTFRQVGVSKFEGHFQPGRTVKIPLGTDDDILSNMRQKTRYNVRLAQRRGVQVESRGVDSIDEFYALMQDTSDRNDFGIHTLDYYRDYLDVMGDRAIMLFALVDDGTVAASLIAGQFGGEAIYMYGASSTANRAHGAAFLLQYEAMRWARDHGCDTYDLWGIPDQDPEPAAPGKEASGTSGDDWRGLHRFKTGFGGEIVTYPPMMERRHLPLLPTLVHRLNLVRA